MMTDAINAKSDVLGERELDAVSRGMSIAGLVGLVDQFIKAAGGGTSGGGQDSAAQQFQQLLQQLTHG
jgi:hypothetical protein